MINEEFNIYMERFKLKPLKERQSIVFEQLKILSAFCQNMCSQINANSDILINRELVDLNNNNYTEDDFAEAILVLINSIQNSLSEFNLRLSDIIDIQIENI